MNSKVKIEIYHTRFNYGSITAFQQLSAMLKSNLKDCDYRHFPSIIKVLSSNQNMITYNPNKFNEEIESVDREIQRSFQDFKNIENIVTFFLNVYQKNLNLTEISNLVSLMFDVNSTDVDIQITIIYNK